MAAPNFELLCCPQQFNFVVKFVNILIFAYLLGGENKLCLRRGVYVYDKHIQGDCKLITKHPFPVARKVSVELELAENLFK